MNIHIALDSYFFFERENFQMIKEFLDENKVDNELYKILPFSHEIQPALPTDKIIVPFGCIEFVQEIRKTHLNSIVLYDEEVFTNENCLKQWGPLCLNHDAQIMTVKEAVDNLEKGKKYFMRPVEDLKSFTGNLFEVGHLPSLLERYAGYENNQFNSDSTIIVSEPKTIKREWRNFIVDGNVVSSSLYKENGKHKEELGAPAPVVQMCYNAISLYTPAKAFVLDICSMEDGTYGIVEFGCIHNCGFYKADVKKVMSELLKVF